MTSLRITNVHLVDPERQTVELGNVTVKNGRIAKDDPSLPSLDGQGKYLAPGIVDIGAKVCEPGERHKESFRSAGLSAAAGGVTTLITRPDTEPAIDSPETLEYANRRAQATCAVRAESWCMSGYGWISPVRPHWRASGDAASCGVRL